MNRKIKDLIGMFKYKPTHKRIYTWDGYGHKSYKLYKLKTKDIFYDSGFVIDLVDLVHNK